MRTRSTIATIATAAILTTTAIAPANAFTEVYTNDDPKSCVYISDDNLSPIYDQSFGFFQFSADLIREAQNLPFATDVHEWYDKNPNLKLDDLHHDQLPADITKKMSDAGFADYEFFQLMYLITDKTEMSRYVGGLLSRELPTKPDSEVNKGRQHFVKKITKKQFLAEQAKAKDTDLSSGEKYVSSTSPGSAPSPTEPYSDAYKELLETTFTKSKPRLKYAKEAFLTSTYDDYVTAFNKRQKSVAAASAACGKWTKGELSQDAIPHFTGTKEAYHQRLTSLHTFIGPKTPTDDNKNPGDSDNKNPGDSKDPTPNNSSSGSQGGIALIAMAILAVIGGIGAWLSGLIPGLPNSPFNHLP